MKEASDKANGELSLLRRVTTIIVLLTALAAGLSTTLPMPIPDKQAIVTSADAAWLKALLLAYGFGTVLVPFGLGDIREPVAKTLKIWAVMLTISEAVWLLPLTIAPRYGWSNDGCLRASLAILLLPTLVKPLLMFRRLAKAEGTPP